MIQFKTPILHVGWFSHLNLGDDLMTLAIHDELKKRVKDLSLSLACKEPPRMAGQVHHWFCKAPLLAGSLSPFWETFAARKYHALLIGGGAILRTTRGIQWKARLARNVAGDVHGVGLSVGPFKDKQAERRCQEFVRRFRSALVRDRFSYDFFKENAPDCTVELTYDMAALVIKQTFVSANALSVVLMKPKDKNESGWQDNLVSTLRMAGHKLRFFIFCSREDSDYVRKIAGKDPVFLYDGHPEEFLRELTNCSAIISSRYHGTVIGNYLGIPHVAIPSPSTAHKHVEFSRTFPTKCNLGVHTYETSDVRTLADELHHVSSLSEPGRHKDILVTLDAQITGLWGPAI